MSLAKEFFLSELPPLIAEAKAKLGDKLPKLSYELEFEIDGEGMYSVLVKNGDAVVRRGGAANPLVAVVLAPVTFDQGLVQLVRPRLKQLAGLDLDKAQADADRELAKQLGGRKPVAPEAALAAVKALPLRVVVEVTGATAEHKLELRTAGAEEDDPTVTVTVSEADVEAMAAGQVAVQEAFKQGRLKMKGAVTTVMALLSRLFV